MERVYQLHKAVKHGEQEITSITIRQPTIDEILKLGYPYNLDPESGAIVHDPAVILRYVSTLTALPPSTIKQMSIADFEAMRWIIVGFFKQSVSESEEETALSA